MTFSTDSKPIKSFFKNQQSPFLIAGPCSAESEEQVLQTAVEIAETSNIDALRAGIWKPRTRPNAFEGVGEQGLQWLKTAGKKIGVPVITEVANAQHVEMALKANIDMLWIGARTTVNPFFVQEIADALRGVDIPVLVKNPINPDLNLWIGALERLQQVGISRLGAIHRGFSSFDKSVYRNVPMWEIPIQLKAQAPQLEIICDPSHIAGSRDLLVEICQRAYDLDFAGLMIETHTNPAEAKSDKEQQVSPMQLQSLLQKLQPRQNQSVDVGFRNKLEALRNAIDDVDNQLLKKLAERMELVEHIGQYKKENNVAVLQIERWKEILETRGNWGKVLNIDEEMVNQLLELLHQFSIKSQTEIMDGLRVEK